MVSPHDSSARPIAGPKVARSASTEGFTPSGTGGWSSRTAPRSRRSARGEGASRGRRAAARRGAARGAERHRPERVGARGVHGPVHEILQFGEQVVWALAGDLFALDDSLHKRFVTPLRDVVSPIVAPLASTRTHTRPRESA